MRGPGACRWRDYPRAGGEDRGVRRFMARRLGLPPRRRGRRLITNATAPTKGTTPAQAGKTGDAYQVHLLWRDYPRAGGEDERTTWTNSLWRGLPPRRRGRPAPSPVRTMPQGTTPAQAGKTGDAYQVHLLWRDYPRAGGEDERTTWTNSLWRGLPPRRRGRPAPSPVRTMPQGTTPAQAGKTDERLNG